MLRRPPRHTGLSRFEFAVAVALIGVLIAIALPRLAAPIVAARQVRLKMLLATTQSAAALFHGECAIRGACERLVVQGQAITGVHGWPAASLEGIAATLKPWVDTADIGWQSDSIDGVPVLRARLKAGSEPGTCEFIYAQAASPGAAPRIALVDATCS